MNETIIKLLCEITESICVMQAAHAIGKKWIHMPKRIWINSIAFLLVMLFSPFISNSLIQWLLGQASLIIYIFVSFPKASKQGRCYLYCATCTILVISQAISAILLSLCKVPLNTPYMGIVGNLLSLAILEVVFLIPLVRSKIQIMEIDSISRGSKILILNTYLVIQFVMLSFRINNNDWISNAAYFVLILAMIAMVNFSMLYYDEKEKRQAMEIESYKKNLPIYQTLIDDIRSQQHEYSNRMQSLQVLIETSKTYEEIASAINEYTNGYLKPLQAYPLLQINRPLLAASLYNSMGKAQERGVNVNLDIQSNVLEFKTSENTVTDLACILVDNAIEESNSGDHIYARIACIEDRTEIEVRNRVDRKFSTNEIGRFFEKNYSTKEGKQGRGLGLYYLSQEVKKNHATIQADCVEFQDEYWMIMKLTVN